VRQIIGTPADRVNSSYWQLYELERKLLLFGAGLALCDNSLLGRERRGTYATL
jgi:hypothetical protein